MIVIGKTETSSNEKYVTWVQMSGGSGNSRKGMSPAMESMRRECEVGGNIVSLEKQQHTFLILFQGSHSSTTRGGIGDSID